MALFGSSKMSEVTVKDPRKVFADMLGVVSGTKAGAGRGANLFYRNFAFQGVKDGVGCSTLVANTALALAELDYTVCVVDTSMLAPCQDVLLKTDYKALEKKDRVDWFDIITTKKSVLNISKRNSKISVLSFQDRTIVDMISVNDNPKLVEVALSQLKTKFDIILFDICHEPTSVVSTCMQLSHRVIQIWNNAPHMLDNIESFITNNTICSCPLDKMRQVVTSMTVDDIPTDWDSILKQYRFTHLANVGLSKDIARINAVGKVPFNYASSSEDVEEFNDCISAIVCYILSATTGSISAAAPSPQLHSASYSPEPPVPIYRTLEEVDASLNTDGVGSTTISDSDLNPVRRLKDNSGVEEVESYMKQYTASEAEFEEEKSESERKKKHGIFGKKDRG